MGADACASTSVCSDFESSVVSGLDGSLAGAKLELVELSVVDEKLPVPSSGKPSPTGMF